MNITLEERPDSYRSWLVAVVGAMSMVFTFGTPMSYGVFQRPLYEEFGLSLVAISFVFSLMLFTFFVGSGLVGIFAVRLPARLLLLVCAGSTAMLAPSLYVVDTYVGLVIAFSALGLALGTVFVLLASIIPRWFDERRGVATGLIFVGNGLGVFLLPPVWQYLVSEYGIQMSFFIILSATSIAFFLAGVTCRRPRWATQTDGTTGELLEWVRKIASTRPFQLLFVGIGLSAAWYPLFAAYAVDLFAYRGLTETAASALFGIVGGISIISRIGGGYIADMVGSRRAFVASLACSAVGILLLLVPEFSILVLGVFLIGIGLGGVATLYIPLLMGIYNPKRDTVIIGLFNVAGGLSVLVMPPLGAATMAYTDDYTSSILLTFVIMVAGLSIVKTGIRIHEANGALLN